MDKKFTHLHLHTQYSLLDGLCNIKRLVSKAKSLGMDAMAITDHGAMFGAVEFYKECKAQEIKPIIGCEIYMAERSMLEKESQYDRNNYHLVLLAENETGYKNLVRIVSTGYTQGYYYKPRVDFDVLQKYSKGIIALTGCIAGKVPSHIIRGDISGAMAHLEHFISIFGKDNVFVEIQDHGMEQEKKANEYLIKFAKEKGLGLVATNDAHYIEKNDSQYHDILLCVQTASTFDDPKRMKFPNNEFYVKSYDEMNELFKSTPEAIENTNIIANRCEYNFEFHNYHLPKFELPDNTDAKTYLRELCEKGLKEKYNTITPEINERLDYELSVINDMGFNDYFLIVWDFIRYAKEHDIPVGPGRGSAAGSIVSYCLSITEIDPIKYSLIFERFLNSERVSMPDIDTDICIENRHKIIEYIIKKYHEENVSQIITFGTLGAKQAIRDVGRSIGMSYADCDKVAKEIPSRPGTTFESAFKENPTLQQMVDESPEIARLIEISRALEGCPRHASTHAAGVVISDKPLMEYLPLYVNDGNVATQFNMTTVEELGLLKMDLLGLRNLTVIKDTIDNIKLSTGKIIDLQKLRTDDPKVYKLISKGDTLGVFQLEGAGMSAFMQNLQPDCLEDIIAGISLYRPGPMQYIDTYIVNKKNPAGIKYIHHTLEPILNVTYGCMVYQEQVMQIVRDLAGFPLSESDNVRRAMSKKKKEAMKSYREIFINGDEAKGIPGCVKNGVDEKSANKIYDEMMDFASYAFNKSHAAAYAVVAYQTAFLKTYYPAEFLSALLSSVIGFDDKIIKYIRHLKDKNIDLLSPDINESNERFTVVDGKIRYGLLAVKSLGENAASEIIEIRKEKGRFTDFMDFVTKMKFDCVNKRGVENLIKSGAFDSLGHTRRELLNSYSDYIDGVLRQRRQLVEGQMNLFDMANESEGLVSVMNSVPKMKEMETDELLLYEKESMGLYISGHPLKKYSEILDKYVTHDSISLNPQKEDEEQPDEQLDDNNLENDQEVIVGGTVSTIKTYLTKSDKPMAFVTMEDLYGVFEVVVFPKTYQDKSYLLKKDIPLLIKGRISKKDEASISVSASSIYDLSDPRDISHLKPLNKDAKHNPKQSANTDKNKSVDKETKNNTTAIKQDTSYKADTIPDNACVVIILDDYVMSVLEELKKIMLSNAGNVKVLLHDKKSGKKYLADKKMWIGNNVKILTDLRNVAGYENVRLM